MHHLITDHLDIWTTAEQPQKSGSRGRAAFNGKSPHGIQKLRELILELAVRGKLVPQDPNDEPASELLKKIASEKSRLIKEGKTRKQQPLPAISEDETPECLPNGWSAARLGEILNVINGRAYKKNEMLDEGIPLLRVGNLFTSNDWYYSDLELEPDKYIDDGDLIYAWSASFGPFIWQGGRVIYHYHIWKLDLYEDSCMDKNYLYNYLAAATEGIKASGNGIAMIHMTKDRMERLVVAVPPLVEQHRIVAKVDELMALCDQLEQEQAGSSEAHQTLVETLLATLTQAEAGSDFAEAWQRIADHFDILFTTEQSIDQLKQTILQLAVMGKLVPQDPADEPASELLKKIAAEKARLIKAKTIRKSKEPMTYVGAVAPIPDNWVYSTLYDVGEIGPRMDAPDNTEASFVPMTLISEFYGVPVRTETKLWHEIKSGFTHFGEGDVALAKITPCFQNGKSSVMCGLKNMLGAGTTELHIFRPISDFVLPEYVLVFLKSPSFIQEGIPKMTGSAGQKRITRDYFAGKPFPLPPVSEQHRIVAKVDELMAICDGLKARLQEAKTTQVHLADTIVEQAVS